MGRQIIDDASMVDLRIRDITPLALIPADYNNNILGIAQTALFPDSGKISNSKGDMNCVPLGGPPYNELLLFFQ